MSSQSLTASKVQDWARFYRASQPSYKPWALEAVLRNDGPKMLAAVLKALEISRPEQVIEAMRDSGTDPSPRKDVPIRPIEREGN